ncbi:hypothetical protein IAU60_002004 [Kwoniella sp. DSM 27419]
MDPPADHPAPPPRPSSAYAPLSQAHPSAPLPPWQQERAVSTPNHRYGDLLQPRPSPLSVDPQLHPPPRRSSLYDPGVGLESNAGYADENWRYDPQSNATPHRALSPPTYISQGAPDEQRWDGNPSTGHITFSSTAAAIPIATTLHHLDLEGRPRSTYPDMSGSHQVYPSSSSSSISSASTVTEPPRTFPLPTVEGLQAASVSLDALGDGDQLAWAQDVIRLVDRHLNASIGPTDFTHPDTPPPTTAHLPGPLRELLEMAVPIIIVVSTCPNAQTAATGLYLKAKLQSSGLCPEMLPKNQRLAFKDFESAARGGETRGWFRLGRDYEGVGDMQRAKDCYERGLKRGDCECAYRMGMAHLLGQLNLPPNPGTALGLLRQASDISTIDVPQPSYVYGMLLAGELSVPTEIPSHLVLPPTSAPNEALWTQWTLARDAIERAAYLCYPPAQYKAGHLYEHAALGCPYDPLVSVNWYTYASKNGETEADMALSKWFLCGAEGNVPKNENLARTFADKAARKGHPNGCFALGYYYELGVGGRRDLDQARKWYQKAANLGNADAPARLAALSAPVPTSISMAEHETRLNDTLVRRRTQAKIRSDRASISRPARRSVQPQAGTATRAVARAGRGESIALPMPVPAPTPTPVPRVSSLSASTSPAPRPGEIMSPNFNANANASPIALPTFHSFPSRPPIPHGAFAFEQTQSAQPSLHPGEPQTYPRRQSQSQSQSHSPGPAPVGQGSRRPTIGSQVSTSTSLCDLPVPERRSDGQRKEAQTFAEMGFVSKPVQEEGCVVM